MVIIGAKGFAKKLLQVLFQNGVTEGLVFFDNVSDDLPEKLFSIYPIIRSFEELEKHFATGDKMFSLGVGGSETRHILFNRVSFLGGLASSIVSKHALIGPYGTSIGEGSCVLANTIIECDVQIGIGCLINNGAMLSHDSKLGKFCEISPGAKILGRVTIGDYSEIGANSVILPDISIGENCRIGAGSVVTRNVADNSTVMGVPARPKGDN